MSGRLAIASALLFAIGLLLGRTLGADVPPPAAPPAPAPRADRAPPPPRPAPDVEPLAESLGLVDPGPGPAGDGTIRGTVAREDGRPLASVVVRAVPRLEDWNPDPGLPAGDPLLYETREELRHALLTARGTREATSGTDGSFAVTGLGDGRYGVRGYRRGFSIRTLGGSDRAPGDTARLLARPVVLVRIDVRDPDGSPPERAWINFRTTSGYGRGNSSWTPESPWIALGPGPAKIRAYGGDGTGERRTMASEEREMVLEEGPDPAPVVLTLHEWTGLRVSLTYPPMDVDANFSYEIAALRIREGGPRDPERLRRDRHATARSHSYGPSKGTADYVLPDLTPGLWLVGAIDGRSSVLATTEVRVTEGIEDVALAVAPPDAGGAIRLRVLDPDGRPVEHGSVNVQAYHRGANGSHGYGRGAEFLGDGVWRVYRPKPVSRDAAGGKYVIQVGSREFGESITEYDPDAGPEISVRLETPAELTVILPGYAGSRYEGRARVTLLRREGSRLREQARERPGPEGRTVFDSLAPGEWAVRLSVDVAKYARETVLETPVTLGSGSRVLPLSPPPLHDLTVLDARPGVTYQLEPVDGRSWRRAAPGADGEVAFPCLTPGDYLLWEEYVRAMPIHVTGDATVRFAPRALDALRVSIRDPAGPLATAGLRDGDLIVAIDGKQIDDRLRLELLMGSASYGGPVPVTVLRNGERIGLAVDLAAARDPRKAGGTLRPWPR